MSVPLAAIADDGDLLGLDEIEIGIPIVIDAHDLSLVLNVWWMSGWIGRRPGRFGRLLALRQPNWNDEFVKEGLPEI
ncbi:hypothetical protein GCM10007276_19940 [Agaricicola taiwanensis]|uniref:Uncharacterized protein n=1 Tax=Agaricicola taiwanensis TaxID=591372 RepID=A0A8J2YHD4_9RHOB|nr:hypothetical protein GCM10007276_19940 [Agaricicola taiwanensis]